MNRFDDEVRDALRGQADRVAPTGDLLGGIVLRAARARKRRRRARIAAGTCAVLAIAAASPYAAHALRRHDGTPKPIALAPLAPATTAPAEVRSAQPTPIPAKAVPANALPWPVRGASASAEVTKVAQMYCQKIWNVGAITLQQLWTGKLAGKTTGYVGQCWPASPTAKWQSTLIAVEMPPDTAWYVRTGGIFFTHPSPGENPAALRTDMQRVAVLTIDLGSEVLALAGPGTDTLWYAGDGVHFRKLSTDSGAARFVRAKSPTGDLIQARNKAGQALTHPDAFAVRIAQHRVVQPGWALVDIE